MSQFLYFIPDVPAASPHMLAELGISAVVGGCGQGPIESGPSGGRGVLLAASEGPKTPLRYDREAQRWFPAGPDKKYFLGFDPGAPGSPGPADLARPRLIPGADVKLADGNLWRVPIARLATGGTMLPLRLGLDGETGEDTARIGEAHLGLWEMAGEVWARNAKIAEGLAAAEQAGVPLAEAEIADPLDLDRRREIAAAALGANYRLGRWEIAALELLGLEAIGDVLDVLVDFASVVEMAADAKKNGPPADGT